MRRLLLAFLLTLPAAVAYAQTPARSDARVAPPAPWLDETRPFASRAADLVSQMTLEEKANQMKDVAPAIERLGIPAYNWWNEALHGVARAGLATVFPQAIGLAATWDTTLMFKVATVISDEGRAKYHEALRHDAHGRYQGLTFWSPNINIFRDPRWGRGQETYGEDPFLTGTMAVQFIRGLQGNDPKYFKTIATVKHYAVHSGPESDRHTFNAIVNERDLRETYLPQFEMGIRDAHAYSLMCAYNRIDGSPACASEMLEKNILRGEWGFNGYIVSDCGAIDDIYLRHKTRETAAEAAAAAVKTGTDLDCGRVYPNLVEAVTKGIISEASLDTSLNRLFLARMKLGMFDAPEHVRWANIPYSIVDSKANRELALETAHKSIVLLKNERNALPLRKTLKTIAVIGPNADQHEMLFGNYNGTPSFSVTPLQGIRNAARGANVVYARGSDLADGFPVPVEVPSATLTSPDGARGAKVEIFNTRSFDGTPSIVRTDSTVSVNWGYGSPGAGIPVDSFAVRWTSTLTPTQSGSYTLGLNGTMRFRLLLDDSVVANSFTGRGTGESADPRTVMSRPMQLQAGHAYKLVAEGLEGFGDAQLQLYWSTPSDSLADDAVRIARDADAVVMVLGLTARLEGEEMPISVPGFSGGDRVTIDLPAPQQKLLERISAMGKPTVLVLLNGSALAVNWAKDNVPAIVEAWYPGQDGGTALADVLFGDYNPAGRLPVTFYKDTTDLPAFSDYRMDGRTYRYFKGTPLYAFGHGLSYTKFTYANLRVSAPPTSAKPATVSVSVTNTGKVEGEEVVQMYVRVPSSKVARANRELRGFQRIALKPGERKRVTMPLTRKAVAYWDEGTHAWVVEPGRVDVEIGASSADIRLTKRVVVKGGAP